MSKTKFKVREILKSVKNGIIYQDSQPELSLFSLKDSLKEIRDIDRLTSEDRLETAIKILKQLGSKNKLDKSEEQTVENLLNSFIYDVKISQSTPSKDL